MLKTQHHQDKTEKHPNQKTSGDDEKRKKKAGAERGRGVGVEHEGRVEVGERVREEENTRGTPNPPKGGLGFHSA